jgi:hypothetical protein
MEEEDKTVLITIPGDPGDEPTVEFTGDWAGREFNRLEKILLKGWKNYKKLRLEKAEEERKQEESEHARA